MAKDLNNILLSTIEENKIKEKTPDKLPLNPTAEGWSGHEVRRFLAKSLIDNEGSFLAEFKKKMTEIKTQFEDVFGQGNGDIQGQIDSIIQNIDSVESAASSLATTVLNNYNSLNNLKVNRTLTILGIDLQDNITLSEFKTALGDATTFSNGLMSALDKQNLAQTMLDIQSLFSDKADKTALAVTDQNVVDLQNNKVPKTTTIIGLDLQDNILIGEFRTVLGNATQSVAGLLSAEDKTHLDGLVALLETSDGDTIVNTIGEILDIFQNYPEGADLVTVLQSKVDKVAGKGLSTNDFTDLLKSKLDSLLDGSQYFDKTYIGSQYYDRNYIDTLKDQNGWESELLGTLSNNGTIALSIINQYDEIQMYAKDTLDVIDNENIRPSLIQSGDRVYFFDDTKAFITVDTVLGFYAPVGYTLQVVGLKYTELKAVETVYNNISSGLDSENIQEAIDELEAKKVDKNANITAGTRPKITYDSKGLVTAGADLVEADIPALSTSKITQTASARFVTDTEKTTWNNKVDEVPGKDLSTNDLTNTLKTNYDTAYTHSQTAHAPSNAQKNSNITKAEIEAKLTGQITSHSHALPDHTHDDRYYTETEVDTKLAGKANATHTHTKSQVSDLIEATQAISGLMSTTDKTRLDVLHALLEEDTENNVVDSINEVLAIFNNYPEGADLVTALAGKVDKVTGKGLSTNDLTNALKSNYDTAFNWGDHAVEGYLKEITKAMVEAVLKGTITTHNHDSLYYTESEIDSMLQGLPVDGHTHTESNITDLDKYTQAQVDTLLNSKVDEVPGKGLSTNDYTTIEKNKLEDIASGAEVNVQSNWDATSGDALILNKPYIPNKVSDLTNDKGYITGYTETDPIFTAWNKSTGISITKSQVSDFSHKHVKADITDFSHKHVKADITDFAHNHDDRYYTEGETNTLLNAKLNTSLKGSVNGLAELGSDGKVPSSQLPSYVDDVLEYTSFSNFPSTGESGKIYISQDTNKTYRWSGSGYVEISASLALGETSSTAGRGDWTKTAHNHTFLTNNPHGVTTAQIGAEPSFSKNTAFNKNFGTSLNTVAQGNHLHTGVYEPANANIQSHIGSASNPHNVSKSQVGLGNVNNTSDLNKPISTAQQTALDDKVDIVIGKVLSTNDYTTTEKNKLSGIQDGAQVNAVTKVAGRTGAVVLAKADVGLGNVQNYAMASKTQAEAGTSNVFYMTPLRTKELITVVMGDIESALDALLGV